MEKKEKDDIVALVYGIDKSKSISDTRKDCRLLFDFIQQELDKARREGAQELNKLLAYKETYRRNGDIYKEGEIIGKISELLSNLTNTKE